MLRYVNTAVVFQEIPGETTLAINISNCPCHCPGCHSLFLWKDIGEPLTTAVVDDFAGRYGASITCLAFMGGDSDPLSVNKMARYIHDVYPQYKVGWYTGRLRVPPHIEKKDFDYIKVGPYIAHLGPLTSPATNQRMYKRMPDNSFKDITYLFRRK